MKKCKSFVGRNLVYCLALLCTSCGDLYSPNTEYFFVSAENKEWLIDTNKYEEFSLSDNQALTEHFQLTSEWEAFNSSRSSSGLFGLKDREYREYEVIEQVYRSQLDKRFSINLEGAEPPEGQIMEIRLDNNYYFYDLLHEKLLSINTEPGRRPDSEFIDDKLVEYPLLSFAMVHDTVKINEVEYYDVLEFVHDDFKDQWEESTIVSVSVAKEVGLLQYKLHGGRIFNRVESLQGNPK